MPQPAASSHVCNGHKHGSTCTCGFGGVFYPSEYKERHWDERWEVTLPSKPWRRNDDDYCRETQCPRCQETVFFVRHNGGCAWFNSLGKPWPKHGCLYGDDVNTVKDFIPASKDELKTLQSEALSLSVASGLWCVVSLTDARDMTVYDGLTERAARHRYGVERRKMNSVGSQRVIAFARSSPEDIEAMCYLSSR